MTDLQHKFKKGYLFALFTFSKLPSLWFWGVKVVEFTDELCVTKIRYSWFTKNPFQSIYFSALSGVAELSTGLLVQRWALQKKDVSMLVVKSEAQFHKKAKGTIFFTCKEGQIVTKAFDKLQHSGDQMMITLTSEGRDMSDQVVASFTFTWSIKKR